MDALRYLEKAPHLHDCEIGPHSDRCTCGLEALRREMTPDPVGQPEIEILTPVSIEEQEAWLLAHGFTITTRDQRANTDHEGAWMVIDNDTYSILQKTELTFEDASSIDGWCLVSDYREDLIRETYDMHYEPEAL